MILAAMKLHDSMIGDAGGAGEAATGATEPRCNTPLLIKKALAAAALAEIASGKKKKKSHKKSKNTSKKKSKKGKLAWKVKKGKSAKDKAAAQNADRAHDEFSRSLNKTDVNALMQVIRTREHR